MATPGFAKRLLGWRNEVPNTADTHSVASRQIAARILELLGISPAAQAPPSDPGPRLEEEVRGFLEQELPLRLPSREWVVGRRSAVTQFVQYEHLARLQDVIEGDESGTLAAEIGRDYVIAPDVTVGIQSKGALPFLHASVSCKWTIRSDRVQNIRHEAVILTRHRRGRQPHIVVVTAEPLPSRLAAIARGTGEVDNVYHLVFDELVSATNDSGTALQKRTLEELINQHRLSPFDLLPDVLSL